MTCEILSFGVMGLSRLPQKETGRTIEEITAEQLTTESIAIHIPWTQILDLSLPIYVFWAS